MKAGRRLISGALLSLAVCSSASADTFLIATGGSGPVVQLRDSDTGAILAEDPLPANAEGAFLLHGNYGQQAYGLVRLSGVTASFELRSFNETSICSFDLGKDVARVQTVEVDNSGTDSIVVQTLLADEATVYSPCGQMRQQIAVNEGTNLALLSAPGGIIPGLITYPKKKKDGLPSLLASGTTYSFSAGTSQLVPDTDGNAFRALLRQRTAVALLNDNGEQAAGITAAKKDSIFSLKGNGASAFGTGNPNGAVSIFNRNGTLLREFSLGNLARGGKRAKGSSLYPRSCRAFHSTVNKARKGFQKRDAGEYFRNATILRRTKVSKRCFVRADKPLDPAISLVKPVFFYGTSLLRLSSNSGDRKGPCSKFLKAEDGTGGFLVKNSDHEGLVYLTPPDYFNGRVLDKNTFKVKTATQYSGLANGLRGHHRITSQNLPRPAHIFAADISPTETHCWRIPGGKTRID